MRRYLIPIGAFLLGSVFIAGIYFGLLTWAQVSGKLIFPATSNGKSILDGAKKLTLTIVNVDAPSRIFEWQLN